MSRSGLGADDHADRVGAAHLGERAAAPRVEPPACRQVVLDEVREHLGVGLRA